MATIMVPVMPFYEKEMQTNLRLLETIVRSNGHEPGIEVIGKPEHFLDPEKRAVMIENLGKYAGGMTIISHQWSGNVIYDTSPDNLAFSDLTTERGRKAINAGAEFAVEAIEAGLIPDGQEVYVHTHGGELYFGERMSEADLKHNQDLIIQSLLGASERHPRIRIGLENLPLFPNSDDPDLIHKPEKVGRTVFEELTDYRRAVENTPIVLTFDSAHYAYDASIGERIDIVSAVDIFGGYLRHLHISDARGVWEPGKSVARDGYIPGEGKIGIEEFKRFFTHIKENYDLSIVTLEAEVQDDDYDNPINREETLKRMVKWLS